MRLDKEGYEALHEREGLKLKPYLDTENVPTIALGNTFYENGTKVTMKDKALTKDEAIHLGTLTADKFALRVSKLITSQVNQNQFNALVSLCYNIGQNGFANSTVLRLVNKNPNDIKIADAIAMWRKNEEVRGRRTTELKQYFDYKNASIETKKYIDTVIKDKLI
jgi:lysozyme